MNYKEWELQFAEAYGIAGNHFLAAEKKFLSGYLPESPSEEETKKIATAQLAMVSLFFHKIQKGGKFGEIGRIEEIFGRSLEENYGLESGLFMDFARAYWTFRLEKNDLYPDHKDTVLAKIVSSIDFDISSIFFPTPGPVSMPVNLRRKAQIRWLKTYAKEFDTDRFVEESPYLNDRSTARNGGCFAIVVIVVISFAAGYFLF